MNANKRESYLRSLAFIRGQYDFFLLPGSLPIYYHLRHALTMIRGVAKRELRCLGAAVVEMCIVLPCEAHAAMNLDSAVADFAVGVARVGLGYRHGQARFRNAFVNR